MQFYTSGDNLRLTIDNGGQLILGGDGSDQTTKWHSGSAYVNAKLDVRQLAIAFSGTDKITSDTSGNFTFSGNVGIGGSPSSLLHLKETDGDANAGPILTLQRDNSASEDNNDIIGEKIPNW